VDLNTEGLLTNYSATNFRLVMWAQERLGEIQRQLDDLKKAAGAAPSDSAKAAIAAKEKERDEKIAFAEKYLQLNARILPREWRNNYYGAQLYQAVKDFPKAEVYYKKGLQEAPNPRFFGGNLAQLYMEQNKFAQAESLLNALKSGAPNDFELWYGLSDLYQKRGDPKKAHAVLSEWLRANPSHQYAGMVSQQIQFLESQMRAPAPTASAAPADSGKAAAPDKTDAKPGEGGIPGLAPTGKPAGTPSAPAQKQKDTALKGQAAPTGKKS
jgi:tetratricopeptide (TPR) repeat protein